MTQKEQRDPVPTSNRHLGYLAVDLALNVDLDGQMCSRGCNRPFAISIYLFDQYHIPPAPVFDILSLAVVDFPTLIHVRLLYQLSRSPKFS